MKISHLAFIAFHLNGALGSGKYDDIDIETVKNKIESREIFAFLKDRLGYSIDTSLFEPNGTNELLEEWIDMSQAIDESKKFCVVRGGLCLLVAYLLEGIQRRAV